MFDAIIGMQTQWILSGIIWSVVLGFAAGNYACSLVYRLPRGKLILDKKPYCGNCGTLLQVRDLFPVISALMLRHRCRYCGVSYPTSHTWTEFLVGLLFVLLFLQWGFGEQYLLIAVLGILLITLAAIEVNNRRIMTSLLVCIAVCGMLIRVLQDGSIYGFFNGGLYMLVVGGFVFCKRIKKVGHVYSLPNPVILMTIGGLCVGEKGLILFLMLFSYFYCVQSFARKIENKDDRILTVAFGIATFFPIMYPGLPFIFQ